MATRVYLAPGDYVTIHEAERWDVMFNKLTGQDVLYLYGSNGKVTAQFTSWCGVESK